MKNALRNLSLILILAILGGCNASKLTGSWSKGDAPKKYNKTAVIVMTPKTTGRAIFEVAMMESLKAKGINATHTMDIFPMAGTAGLTDSFTEAEIQEVMDEKLAKNNADVIMIIALLDREQEQKYVQGASVGVTMPYTYGGGYHGYYGYAYGNVYNTGYYTTTTSYMVQTNLYEVATGTLIYTAQTKTTDPSNMESEIKKLSNLIVYDIDKRKIYDTGS